MRYRLIVLIMALTVSLVSCGNEQRQESEELQTNIAMRGDTGYTYKIQVEKMTLNWAVNNGKLQVKLAAETEGWIGIGFNPSEQMRDANFIIGFVKDGAVTIMDEHGIGTRLHREDAEIGGLSNVIDASASEGTSGTEMAFAIPLASDDTLDTPIDTESDITILLAYGKSDRLAQQHLVCSKLTVNLSSGKYSVAYVTG